MVIASREIFPLHVATIMLETRQRTIIRFMIPARLSAKACNCITSSFEYEKSYIVDYKAQSDRLSLLNELLDTLIIPFYLLT